MRFGPIAATAALLCLVLTLPGCGENERAATTGDGKVATNGVRLEASASTRPPVAARRCRRELVDLLDAIESLSNTLAVGLAYEQYLHSVNGVRASYANVAAERLGIVCLSRVAAPAEDALNIYIGAANGWGDCLATVACDSGSIEPKLQREWEAAADQLARARAGLRGLS
jgi:hypothetical protein